jgi:hypothetical protein
VIDVYFACVNCEMWNASALSHSVLRSKSDDRHMCTQEQVVTHTARIIALQKIQCLKRDKNIILL